jgi:serine/threonine protein kinase
MANMCYQHTQVTPPRPHLLNAKIPPRLSAIIMRCLSKKPADRFGQVQEITGLLISDLGAEPQDRSQESISVL